MSKYKIRYANVDEARRGLSVIQEISHVHYLEHEPLYNAHPARKMMERAYYNGHRVFTFPQGDLGTINGKRPVKRCYIPSNKDWFAVLVVRADVNPSDFIVVEDNG